MHGQNHIRHTYVSSWTLTLKVGKVRSTRNVVRVHQPTEHNIPEIGTLRTVINSLKITNLLASMMNKIWDGNCCSRLYKPTDPPNQEQGRINLRLRVRQHEARLVNPCCRETISITYSEYVFEAFVIQHAKRMRRIIFLSETCLVLQYFSIFS